jgi:hypothetical protein
MNSSGNQTKLRDSSITRVQPVLQILFSDSENEEKRLSKLLRLAPRARHALSNRTITSPGSILAWCRALKTNKENSMKLPGGFEKTVAPPGEFLRWMIEHPERLKPPKSLGSSTETIERRKAILGLPSKYTERESQDLALELLEEKGPDNSVRQWWAFEGFTHVDCVVETEKLVLFIEGKRTETASENVSWFAERNQIARNLECAKWYARKRDISKEFAVLMVIEEGTNEDHHYQSVSASRLLASWPHLPANGFGQGSLIDGFLGIVTWQEILKVWGISTDVLPDTVNDVATTTRPI